MSRVCVVRAVNLIISDIICYIRFAGGEAAARARYGRGGCERVREEYTTNGFTFKIFFDKKGVTQ